VNRIYLLVRKRKVINDLDTVKVKRRMLIKILKLNHLNSTEKNQVKEIERSWKSTGKNLITRIMMTRIDGKIIKKMTRILHCFQNY